VIRVDPALTLGFGVFLHILCHVLNHPNNHVCIVVGAVVVPSILGSRDKRAFPRIVPANTAEGLVRLASHAIHHYCTAPT
jgi:hypothetical protein